MTEIELNINPMIYDVLGPLSVSPDLPSEDVAIENYSIFVTWSADDIVHLISTDSQFKAYSDILRSAIDCMDIRSIGHVVDKFIDFTYPTIMKRLNSNKDESELYKAVVIKLVDEIRKVETDANV